MNESRFDDTYRDVPELSDDETDDSAAEEESSDDSSFKISKKNVPKLSSDDESDRSVGVEDYSDSNIKGSIGKKNVPKISSGDESDGSVAEEEYSDSDNSSIKVSIRKKKKPVIADDSEESESADNMEGSEDKSRNLHTSRNHVRRSMKSGYEDESESEDVFVPFSKTSNFIRPSMGSLDENRFGRSKQDNSNASGIIDDSHIEDTNPDDSCSASVNYKDSDDIFADVSHTSQLKAVASNIANEDRNVADMSTELENTHISENADSSDQSLHSIYDVHSPKGVLVVDSDNKVGTNKLSSSRVSFNVQMKMSSTMIDDSDVSPSIKVGGSLKKELLSPRNLVSSPTSSKSEEIFEICSDSDEENALPITKVKNPPLKQATLYEVLNKPPSVDNAKALPDGSIAVSAEEFQHQKEKVQKMQFDARKVKNLLNTIKLNALPDQGKQLRRSHDNALASLAMEEAKLSRMVVVPEDIKPPPTQTAPKPPSLQDLDQLAASVQPRTFGRRALATHNQEKALTMDRLHQLHGSLKTCPTEETIETGPKGLKVELMLHQKQALAWLIWREKQKPSGGILADDMGLGKTLTMISLMLKALELKEDEDKNDSDSDEENKEEKQIKRYKYYGGTLIVCPASLISQWDGEVKNRVRRGMVSIELYHGAKRETKSKRLANYDMVITTYSIVMNELEKDTPLFKIKWDRIIMDEAHQVRNYKSRTSIAVCQLSAKSRWALTGTPIHNKEVDLYALLKFLRCSPFDELATFKRWASEKNAGGQERLNTVMSSLMLRRTKAQLQQRGDLQCLPERTWQIIEVKLEKQEMDVYQKILVFSRTLFSQFLHQRATKDQHGADAQSTFAVSNDPNGEYHKMHKKLVRMNKMKEVKQHQILVLLLRLRQICCHPSLITAMLTNDELETSGVGAHDEEDDEEMDAMTILDQLNKLKLDDDEEPGPLEFQEGVGLAEATRGILKPSHPIFNNRRQSTKVVAIIKLLKENVLAAGDKCIIVSQWTSFLKLISVHLQDEGIIFDQLDGSVPVHKRAIMIENFNNPSYKAKVLLLSLTAGGVGLNLIGANHLFLLDLHWNPQLEMQAQDRIYRVGQKKPVFVYKFMTLDTIEERIKALQDNKKELAESVLTGAKMQQSKLSLDDLKMLFAV